MRRSYPPRAGYSRLRRKPPQTRVLVIAPHPDDDVLGCGGALARLAARGARVLVLYVTDGSASHLKSKLFPPLVLRDLRECEARDGLRELGIRARPRFLRAPDGKLGELDSTGQGRIVDAIARAIDGLRPQLLFAPWNRDPHPDHVATSTFVERARLRAAHDVATYRYGVWLPIRGSAADAPQIAEATVREIALTAAEVERKRLAIMQHRSQTSDLIADDPAGFRIDEALLAQWLVPRERFYCSPAVATPSQAGTKQR